MAVDLVRCHAKHLAPIKVAVATIPDVIFLEAKIEKGATKALSASAFTPQWQIRRQTNLRPPPLRCRYETEMLYFIFIAADA